MKTPSPPRTSVRQLLSDGNDYSIEEIIGHLNNRRRACGQKRRDFDSLKQIVAPMLQQMQTRGIIRLTTDGRYQLIIPPASLINDEVIFEGLGCKGIAKLAKTSLLGLLNNRLAANGEKTVLGTELKALNAKEGQRLKGYQREYAGSITGIFALRDEMGLSLADLESVTDLDQSMLQNKLDQMIREGKILKTRLDRYKRRI